MSLSPIQHPVNLHTHTPRCNHATGSEREYIENAIAAGLSVLGFSDHTPYPFPDGYYSGFRMRPEQQQDYVETLLALQEEYRGRIDIKIGYEAEYYPAYFSDLVDMLTRYPVDYMIMGQHFLENEMSGIASGRPNNDPAFLKQYVDQVCEGLSTGLFTYLAHPDLANFKGDEVFIKKEYSRLIACAIDRHIPLEINLLGIRDGRNYPSEAFFALAGEMGATVCIGSDAHQAEMVYDAPSRKKAMEMVERYHLKLELEPKLIPLR